MPSSSTVRPMRLGRRPTWLRKAWLLGTVALGAGCGFICLPGTALAQPVATPNAGAGADSGTLDVVVVTARKKVEKIQSIPESIQALGAKELVNAHVTQVGDLGNLVSNLNITTRADQTPDVVLRGVGSFGVVNGVGFYSDDVQLFDGQTVRPEDLDRVEVLKGPQGTIYGGSNIGGAIKFITKLPTNDFTGQASVEYGSYNTRTFSAAVSGPIMADKLGARLSFFDSATDGYVYDPTLNRDLNNGEERGGRLTLQYKDGPTNAILYLYAEKYDGNSSSVYYRPSSPTDYSLEVAAGTLPEFRRGLYSGTLNIDRQLGDGLDLTSITSYFHSNEHTLTDVDKGPLPFLVGLQDFSHNVYTEELRLSGGGSGPGKWLIGAYFQENDPDNLNISTAFTGDPSDPSNFLDPTQFAIQKDDIRQTHREYAIFGNGQYTWNKWILELGLRADYNESEMKDTTYGLSLSQHGVQVLPKISLSYNFAKDIMAYATISRGFEPGDVVESFDVNGDPILSVYKPETTWNYEVGLKSTLFDRVRLNAAAFYLDYANRLFQTNRQEATQFVAVTENIGASENYGVEADISTRLVDRLYLTASAGVTKAVWGKVNFYDPDLSAQTSTNVFVNLNGRTAPFTPAYSASVSLDWSHEIFDGLTFGARIDATAIGQLYWDVTDHFQQPAYQLVNLGVRLEGKNWTVSAHASNVFDVRYNTAFISAAEVGAPTNVAGIGQPSLWSVALAYRF